MPFSGSASAYRELLPGRVQAAFVVLESAVPHLKAGNLRLLAVADPRRNRQFPDTPTLDESFKGLGYDGIFGFIALVLACVNIFGGFLVTERMLSMYKKKG